ncbi:BTB/POZ domain-containing protein [Vitis vinifera]|uniref:BTB/POZ domain-containing protein n=1 Tax=Vitis vinifera TaxID=29760 RepID=A0A438K0G4_VITVI|nr:BTB/POZ domain-containing protein [Vitis vinifera]
MSDSAYRVETTSRLAQWRIDNLASCTYRKSDPFKIGKWNWHLSIEKNRTLSVKLYPETSNLTRDNPPIASFIIRVLSSVGDRKALVHPEITDKQLKNNDDFVWAIEVPLTGKFIVDVEFLDLKTSSPNGGEPCSIWAEGFAQKRSSTTALASLGRMLSENIHTDIIINASDGSIGAHRAVLASISPVFRSMFHMTSKRKNYPPLPLLRAADKLQNASLYQLSKLKTACLRYLVKFGKIFDIRDDFNAFLQCADRDLIAEVFHEVLTAWKGGRARSLQSLDERQNTGKTSDQCGLERSIGQCGAHLVTSTTPEWSELHHTEQGRNMEAWGIWREYYWDLTTKLAPLLDHSLETTES